jgi:predicted nucleotidyltransferase component of viral defense system
LSWILAGISQNEVLKESLVFKGGTALKKAYFGNYRFSEDLDFTVTQAISEKDLSYHIKEACHYATKCIAEFAPNPVILCERYQEKLPHTHGQIAFTVRTRLPWHREPYVCVMIEVTKDERVMTRPQLKQLFYDYESDFPYKILTYSLEEIVSEKLRAILQNVKKLHEVGWTRSRARDYYDLWRILSVHKADINRKEILDILPHKCSGKNVFWKTPEDFFNEPYLKSIRSSWNKWLNPLVPNIPPSEVVLEELRVLLNDILLSPK